MISALFLHTTATNLAFPSAAKSNSRAGTLEKGPTKQNRKRLRARVNQPRKVCRRVNRPRKIGRVPFRDLYPIVALTRQCLNSRPAGARRNRAETTNYTTLTLTELHRMVITALRRYCFDFGVQLPKKLPGKKTIRRLGKPPNPRYRSAKDYKSLVPFSTARRRNDRTKWHQDFHFTAATVKLFAELACYFSDDCVLMSCDNKNKVRFGAPVNTNPSRPRGFYLEDAMPSLPDHTFPTRDAKLVPMGYMTVASNPRERRPSLDSLLSDNQDSSDSGFR